MGSATVSNGQWTYTPGSALAAGDYVFTAKSVVGGTENGAASTFSLSIDLTAPTVVPTITAINDTVGSVQGVVTNGGLTDDASLSVSGTLSAALATGEKLWVYDAGTYLGQATISGTNWSFDDSRTLQLGQTVSYQVRTLDAVGNMGGLTGTYSATVATLLNDISFNFESQPVGNFSTVRKTNSTADWSIGDYGTADSDKEERIYSGSETGVYHHLDDTILATGRMVSAMSASFTFGTSTNSGDGLNISFGLKSTLNGGYERGYGTGLSIETSTVNNTTGVINIWWNGVKQAASASTFSYGSVYKETVDVSPAGVVTVKLNGVTYASATISGWSTQNMSGWQLGYGGRTGGNTGTAWIDDLSLQTTGVNTGSPLVLDLDGNGVQSMGPAHGAMFDLDATGQIKQVGWTDGKDGLLALDLNHNGQIDSGAELFGNATLLANGEKAVDGWMALATLDTTGDGKVDAQDAQFADLRVWVDANTDGLTQSGELKTLAEVGVAGLMVSYDESRIAQNGNILDGAGSFVKTDGSVGRMSDAWFVMAEPELLEPSQITAKMDAAGIQVLDLTSGTAQQLTLKLSDVLSTPVQADGSRTLLVQGDRADVVNLTQLLADGSQAEGQWLSDGSCTFNGETYNAYRYSHNASLLVLIDQQIAQGNVHVL